jgi:ubiquitin-protein ligase
MSLPQSCIKRIARDVSDIHKNSLANNGIFYVHDEENILNGCALIIGPDDTVYENGFYFFKFLFPDNYPYSPPKVTFCNYDNKTNTRFHPNLYRNGKTCLSLLNTWRGDGWTSCQNIRSVLLTLSSILTSNPLTEEPGITIKHRDNIPYNKIITFKNIEISIIRIITDCLNHKLNDFNVFSCIIKDLFEKNKYKIKDKIKNLKNNNLSCNVKVSVYNMECEINYKLLLDNFEKLI